MTYSMPGKPIPRALIITAALLAPAWLQAETTPPAETPESAYADMSAALSALGYENVQEDGVLTLLPDGQQVWSGQDWMPSPDGPRDFTLDGLPNLLLLNRGRCGPRVSLMELGDEGPRAL